MNLLREYKETVCDRDNVDLKKKKKSRNKRIVLAFIFPSDKRNIQPLNYKLRRLAFKFRLHRVKDEPVRHRPQPSGTGPFFFIFF